MYEFGGTISCYNYDSVVCDINEKIEGHSFNCQWKSKANGISVPSLDSLHRVYRL